MLAEPERSGQNTALSDRCRWCKYARCYKVTTALAPVGHSLALHHGVLVQSCTVLHQYYSGVLGQYSGVLGHYSGVLGQYSGVLGQYSGVLVQALHSAGGLPADSTNMAKQQLGLGLRAN